MVIKMGNYFEGWYFKHQKDNNTIAFIPGRTNNSAFIQVITPNNSYNVLYPLSEYKHYKNLIVGNSKFSKNGVKININDKNVKISGEISYSNLTPLKYDVMGIFKYLPMECYHGIVSMRHNLYGSININNEAIDFSNGVGYIESDRGSSFPKSYLWLHWNNPAKKHSIMVSIADIPFLRTHFTGCIGVIYFKEKEYRLATYLGVKVKEYNNKKVILQQGKLRLEIYIIKNNGQKLYAPNHGSMSRTIHECISCKARFKFFIRNEEMFDLIGNNTSFEYV